MARAAIAAITALASFTMLAPPESPVPPGMRLLTEGESPMTRSEAVREEIVQLHEFFEGWFTGQLPDTDAAFRRFSDVMAAEFVLVSPDGEESTRTDLIERLRGAHRSDPDIEIRVEQVRTIAGGDELILARYEEIQESGQERTRRLSTVVFRRAPGAPNGLEWVRVHETWAASPEGTPDER